jgi:hypothetical protein
MEADEHKENSKRKTYICLREIKKGLGVIGHRCRR